MQIELIMIRHGKTLWNEEERYIGLTDMSLSDNGVREIRDKIAEGIYPDIDILYASPLRRCIETAELIYPDLSPIIIDEYKEIDFGRLEGKRFEDMKDDPVFKAWLQSGGRTDFPGYEDKDSYMDRVLRGYERMLISIREEVTERPDISKCRPLTVGIVCHGGTIMSIMAKDDRDSYYSHMTGNGGIMRCLADI